MSNLLRRGSIVFAACVCVSLLGAPVAMADPAKPTNYRSTIDSITPTTGALTLKVVGGDGFLDMSVKRGHTVAVEGYEGEPWLRVLADGTVQENQRSTATYLNSNRYGKVVIPPGIGRQQAIEQPDWRTVAHHGHYVWHDHRIHYMTPEIAPHLVPGTNRVILGARDDGRWVVPISVDGKPVQVVGELVLLQAPTALGWWALVAVLVLAAGGAAGLRGRRAALPIGTAVVGIGAVVGVAAGLSELSVVPSEAGGSPVAVALPAFAVLAAAASVFLRNRATRCIAILAGAAAMLAWGILRVGALSHAVPLSGFSPTLARCSVALVIGTALGGAAAGVRSGALALSPLEDEPSPEGPSPTDDSAPDEALDT